MCTFSDKRPVLLYLLHSCLFLPRRYQTMWVLSLRTIYISPLLTLYTWDDGKCVGGFAPFIMAEKVSFRTGKLNCLAMPFSHLNSQHGLLVCVFFLQMCITPCWLAWFAYIFVGWKGAIKHLLRAYELCNLCCFTRCQHW